MHVSLHLLRRTDGIADGSIPVLLLKVVALVSSCQVVTQIQLQSIGLFKQSPPVSQRTGTVCYLSKPASAFWQLNGRVYAYKGVKITPALMSLIHAIETLPAWCIAKYWHDFSICQTAQKWYTQTHQTTALLRKAKMTGWQWHYKCLLERNVVFVQTYHETLFSRGEECDPWNTTAQALEAQQ